MLCLPSSQLRYVPDRSFNWLTVVIFFQGTNVMVLIGLRVTSMKRKTIQVCTFPFHWPLLYFPRQSSYGNFLSLNELNDTLLICFQDWKTIWRMLKKGKNRNKQITYKEWSVIILIDWNGMKWLDFWKTYPDFHPGWIKNIRRDIYLRSTWIRNLR